MPDQPLVLLVEDSALVNAALRVLFEETGFRVTIAESAADAIVAGTREIPAVMLLDLGLPDADGLEVLDVLTARGRAPRVTIALTGDADETTRRKCIEHGCHDVLVKPVPPRELLRAVRQVVQ
jgi:two-component system KDP operon response regulator KdpE